MDTGLFGFTPQEATRDTTATTRSESTDVAVSWDTVAPCVEHPTTHRACLLRFHSYIALRLPCQLTTCRSGR